MVVIVIVGVVLDLTFSIYGILPHLFFSCPRKAKASTGGVVSVYVVLY